MSRTVNGRNVKIEVALTFAASLVECTAVTKANPGVATKSSHGLLAGDSGVFEVATGMVELNEQAIHIGANDTNTFTLSGLDTTNYSTWATAASNGFRKASTWGLIEEAKGYSVGGGASDQLDDTRIWQNKRSNVAGLNAAEDLNIALAPPEVESAALAFCTAAARNGTSCLFRVTSLKTGKILRVAYGVPSVYNEDLQVGALGTGGFSVTVPQYVLKPNA